MKQIQAVTLSIDPQGEPVNIVMNGKNAIITGGNGCGKTRLMNQLHASLQREADAADGSSVKKLSEKLRYNKQKFAETNPLDSLYSHYKKEVVNLESRLAEAEKTSIQFYDYERLVELYGNSSFLLSYYVATRQSKIETRGNKTSYNTLKTDGKSKKLSEDFGNLFELYLVAMKRMYNDIRVDGREEEQAQADVINGWFNMVEKDLQFLFEDPKLHLSYDREDESYYVIQDSKSPFRFDQLSSGFSAIMNIYADLLIKVELKGIPATQLQGIVLIDEIDAHLHVSLQRKILSFFSETFPNVQFIVTTHSPFVVQSVSDAVVYDLSLREQLDDLSGYSYQAILEGLLGVPMNSLGIEETLDDLSDAIELRSSVEEVENLLNKLEPYKSNLSDEAKALYMQAQIYKEHASKSLSSDNSQHFEYEGKTEFQRYLESRVSFSDSDNKQAG